MKSVIFSPKKLSESCMDTGKVQSYQKPLVEQNENKLKSDSQIPAAVRNFKIPQAPAFLMIQSLQIRIRVRAEFSGVRLLHILQCTREMGRDFSWSQLLVPDSMVHPLAPIQTMSTNQFKKGKNVTLSSRGQTAVPGNTARKRPRGAPQKDPAPLTFPSLQERNLSVAMIIPPCFR